jgi:hypothetical protein
MIPLVYLEGAAHISGLVTLACMLTSIYHSIQGARLHAPTVTIWQAMHSRNAWNPSYFTEAGWKQMRLAHRAFWKMIFFGSVFAVLVVVHAICTTE